MSKKTTLGEVLKGARQLKRLSLRDVEQKTKISNAYISQLESDSVNEPSPHKLHALSKFYEIEYSMLMELAGYFVPQNKRSGASTSNVQALLLTQQPLTDDESNAVSAFLQQYRQFRENSEKSKRESK